MADSSNSNNDPLGSKNHEWFPCDKFKWRWMKEGAELETVNRNKETEALELKKEPTGYKHDELYKWQGLHQQLIEMESLAKTEHQPEIDSFREQIGGVCKSIMDHEVDADGDADDSSDNDKKIDCFEEKKVPLHKVHKKDNSE